MPETALTPQQQAFLQSVQQTPGCWFWSGLRFKSGYGHYKRGLRAHRASYELFRGSIPFGKLVMHLCDNPPCVNPEHLRLGSVKDNLSDRDKKGRTNRKLTWNQVKMIRQLHGSLRWKQQELADAFKVSVATICVIVRFKRRQQPLAYWEKE